MKRSIVLLLVVMAYIVLKSQNQFPFEDAKTKKCWSKNKLRVVVIPAKHDWETVLSYNLVKINLIGKHGLFGLKTSKETGYFNYDDITMPGCNTLIIKLNGKN